MLKTVIKRRTFSLSSAHKTPKSSNNFRVPIIHNNPRFKQHFHLLARKVPSPHLSQLNHSKPHVSSLFKSRSFTSGMELPKVFNALEKIAPTHLAEKWDNVGILTQPTTPALVKTIFLTNDLTTPVMEEAIDLKTNVIVAYHPPLFSSIKRLNPAQPKDKILLRAIEEKISLYSPHTSCDAVQNGVNDWLAKSVGPIKASRPVHPYIQQSREHKLVCFVPQDSAEKVRKALSAAGAGRIGSYTECAFQSVGEGHFTPSATSNPHLGKKEEHSTVPEVKLETVCPTSKVSQVLEALHKSHPYETPAFDIFALQGTPVQGTGQGRWIDLETPRPFSEVIESVKKYVGMDTCQYALALNQKSTQDHMIRTVALCAGSGAEVILKSKADLLLTGEMRHHDVLAAIESGSSVILLNHSNSERGFLKAYAEMLKKALSCDDITIHISKKDKDPLEFI